VASAALLFFGSSTLAAQRSQGRVFTNEDVASPAPAQPAAASETGNQPAPSASQPSTTPAAQPSDARGSQDDELKKLTALQTALTQAQNEIEARLEQASDQALTSRLTAMQECLNNLLTESRNLISEHQGRLQRQQTSP
jgi:hypothetical protein